MLIIYHLSAATECMIQFYDALYLVESFLRFCMIESTPPEHKADLDSEFLTAIAERPNEMLKCAMYLFLGYLAAQLIGLVIESILKSSGSNRSPPFSAPRHNIAHETPKTVDIRSFTITF